MVHEDDVNKILAVRLSPTACQDLLGWHYNENGIYSVKSGYWVGSHLPTSFSVAPCYENVSLKHRGWQTRIPVKLKHFLWRLLSKTLPTGENLQRRHVTRDNLCKRCCTAVETEQHIFFDCSYAKRLWRASGVSNLIINSPTTSLEEKIDACLQCSLSTRLTHIKDLPIWILWRLWKSRNTLNYQQKEIPWRLLLKYIQDDVAEWNQFGKQSMNEPTNRSVGFQTITGGKWKRPPEGWIKCNTDGSFHTTEVPCTAGWVLRDANGVYCGAVQIQERKVRDPLECEMQSILMALQHSWSRGYRYLIIESDCQKAINILNNKQLHFGYYNWTRDIRWWSQRFRQVRFQWTRREANMVADKLAKHEIHGVLFTYYFYPPVYLSNLLHLDHIFSI